MVLFFGGFFLFTFFLGYFLFLVTSLGDRRCRCLERQQNDTECECLAHPFGRPEFVQHLMAEKSSEQDTLFTRIPAVEACFLAFPNHQPAVGWRVCQDSEG